MYGAGSTAVVTGAAGGIGRAIAERLAAEGFSLVLADLDLKVEIVADQLGALAVVGDCASDDGVDQLVSAALVRLGKVDVWVGNAGIDLGRGLETPDEQWSKAYDVNVLAHVRAARRLVPTWLEAGGGRFVVTASAAGLLTMLGSAPYSVTKHGAVAFAEWLRATYGHRGVVVQAICPQGVRTRMLDDAGPLKDLLVPRPGAGAVGGRRRAVGRAAGRAVPGPAAPRGGRLLRRPRVGHRRVARRDAAAAGEGRCSYDGCRCRRCGRGRRRPSHRRRR